LSDLQERLKSALSGRYEIEREVGAGGMATVYLAQDIRHPRSVALKVLDPELAAAIGEGRFLQEIETTASLSHPHILPLLDSGTSAGLLYYVTPYIEGQSLGHRLAKEGQLPLDQAIRITREVADALEYAHKRNILHRDIKPENILLADGHALVADFGIARVQGAGKGLTQTGAVIGTPDYMSPEQATGESDPDARSDVYSLGCVLYEMVAGQAPYIAPTKDGVLRQHLVSEPPALSTLRPSVSEHLQHIVKQAMAKSPVDRFTTAREFAESLSEIRLDERDLKILSPKSSRRLMLAVLPFENLSDSKEHEYFSDGMTEEMIAQLGRIQPQRLGVIARTSAMKYKGSQEGIRRIGTDLGVDYLLEGSVRKAGNRVRITAHLIQMNNETRLWGESYDRNLEDIFAIQSEVASHITESLSTELLPEQRTEPEVASSRNSAAYEAYLKGRYFWNQRTKESLEKALVYFQQAIELEPDNPLAHAHLADAYLTMGDRGFWRESEAIGKASRAAKKALELREDFAEAHISLGHCFFHELNFHAARDAFERGITLNPNYAFGRFYYAYLLAAIGEGKQATQEILAARELDPLSMPINSAVASIFWLNREYNLAIDHCHVALEIDPGHGSIHHTLGDCYRAKGMFPDALAVFQKASAILGELPELYSSLATCHAEMGNSNEARKILETMGASSDPVGMALVHSALGEQDQAFEFLEKAYEERSAEVAFFAVSPELDRFRADPRFTDLLRRIGLPNLKNP
jgi:serine/threonine-protein kinase